MLPQKKLLVVETLIEQNGSESLGNLADLHMMVVADEGRERTREDYAQLFRATGFRMGRVFEAPTISVIEATAA